MTKIKNKKYSVAIIGCGNIGFFFDHKRKGGGALSHFKAFSQNKDFEVVALAEHDPQRRAALSKVCKVPVFYDHKELLMQVRPDVAIISATSEAHEQILRDLLKAKPKLVFAEKPLTLDPETSESLIAEYEKAQVGLQVNYSRRFIGIFQQLKKMLTQRKLGDIQAVNFFYSRGFLNNGPHFIDLMTWYWGKPKEVIVESERPGLSENDPTLSILFKYPEGMEARLIGLGTSAAAIFEMDIWGSKGRVRVVNNEFCEFYEAVRNKDFPDFLTYALKTKKNFDRLTALPCAVKNIAGWLNKKEALISPAADSRVMFQIFKDAKGSVVCQS